MESESAQILVCIRRISWALRPTAFNCFQLLLTARQTARDCTQLTEHYGKRWLLCKWIPMQIARSVDIRNRAATLWQSSTCETTEWLRARTTGPRNRKSEKGKTNWKTCTNTWISNYLSGVWRATVSAEHCSVNSVLNAPIEHNWTAFRHSEFRSVC